MKAKLWGGPHDGLEIEVEKTCAMLRMPVTCDVMVAYKPVDVAATVDVVPFVARYVRIENTPKYLYAGQEKM